MEHNIVFKVAEHSFAGSQGDIFVDTKLSLCHSQGAIIWNSLSHDLKE